ncbi:uncharacterized protein CELE_F54C1.8 [Caenorhabditis elegans]|uniref:Uncharacterized protein n=1 Tax=Caenorhabditis elegans TaxID=6239 RepID=P91325_CAEEL|nr:Uncharacterized protein CELE_F54C1.8 [Caenorhabditis elegans]CCD67550.1 Uncharacterized protein CELE_F54C1.8 [Caenorhabditis elegans]|eukprot:NP_491497.2 Uncharacterized protein CELE_F54C1.8 [Caenorhabditis elegans]
MNSKKSMKKDSNSSSNKETKHENSNVSVLEIVDEHNIGPNQKRDRFGLWPEGLYCVFCILFGIAQFYAATSNFETREVAIITRRCFAAVDIFAGLLAFVLIFKSVRIIYIVLTVFSGITIGLESLTFMDTIYLLQRLPSLGIDKKYENCVFYLFIVALVVTLWKIVLGIFCFYVFLMRSCKSQLTLETERRKKRDRSCTPEKKMGSTEIAVMDY